MTISPAELVTWLIVGAIAGSLVGMLVKRRKEGFGRILNLGLGLVGALVGGLLFKALHINLGRLREVTVNLQDIVAGVLGSLIFLALVWCVRIFFARKKAAAIAGQPAK